MEIGDAAKEDVVSEDAAIEDAAYVGLAAAVAAYMRAVLNVTVMKGCRKIVLGTTTAGNITTEGGEATLGTEAGGEVRWAGAAAEELRTAAEEDVVLVAAEQEVAAAAATILTVLAEIFERKSS